MNLILYLLLILLGYIGVVYELKNRRSCNMLLVFLTFIFFLLAIDKVWRNYDLGDLDYYIEYFLTDQDKYFEPGYVCYTNVIKLLFGYNEYALVGCGVLWVVIFVYIASRINSYYLSKCDFTSNFYDLKYSSYTLCLLFFVIPYWGCFFTWQTIRIGMAITLLYCSTAFFVNHKLVYSMLFAIVAFSFHYSCIIFIVTVLLLYFLKKSSIRFYLLWFFAVLFLRLSSSLLTSVVGLIESLVEFETFSHYQEYVEPDLVGGGFSPQDIAYHLFGLLMIKGNLGDERYNKTVSLYYCGLTLGALLGFTSISMRVQWLYYAMIVFSLYYFVLDKSFKLKLKLLVLVGYTLIEQVMALRQFGFYVL